MTQFCSASWSHQPLAIFCFGQLKPTISQLLVDSLPNAAGCGGQPHHNHDFLFDLTFSNMFAGIMWSPQPLLPMITILTVTNTNVGHPCLHLKCNDTNDTNDNEWSHHLNHNDCKQQWCQLLGIPHCRVDHHLLSNSVPPQPMLTTVTTRAHNDLFKSDEMRYVCTCTTA